MDYQSLLNEIKNPEKETVELKQSFNDMEAIARTIAAFSTKRGGKVYVGVDKNGVPCGTLCSHEISGKLQSIANNEIKPPAVIMVEKVVHDSKKDLHIVCIDVQKGKGVYTFKNVPYERRGDINHPLSPDEVFELQKDIKRIYFDELPANNGERPALLSDVSEEEVQKFLLRTKGIEELQDLKRFLINHKLTVNGSLQVKNAAVLLFGKDTLNFIPQAKLSFCAFPSNTVTDTFVKKEFTGNLFDVFEKAYFEITERMNIQSFIEGYKRIEVPDYPSEVIREILVNAIVHRDYFERNTEIFVKMFSDRIEILNPASFPFENITFEEIKKQGLSKRRNPLVADAFEAVKLMDKEGRGLARIESAMAKHGAPVPVFEVGSKTFRVILHKVKDPQILKNSQFSKTVDFAALNERQKALIGHMVAKKEPISRSDYVALLGVNAKTATRDLNDLVKRGVLIRLGAKKGAKYKLR